MKFVPALVSQPFSLFAHSPPFYVPFQYHSHQHPPHSHQLLPHCHRLRIRRHLHRRDGHPRPADLRLRHGQVLDGRRLVADAAADAAITLANGGSITFSDGYANPELEPDSGDIVYVENRRPIFRSSSQTEDIKLVVEF